MDTPAKLKQAIIDQCGKNVAPQEIGYFNQSTKHWIHNRLDMNDVWDIIESGTKVLCGATIALQLISPLMANVLIWMPKMIVTEKNRSYQAWMKRRH